MLKNFLIRMTLSGLFLLLFSLRFVDMTVGEKITEYPLETAWKVTGLPLGEISTETWMKLNSRWLSVYDLKAVSEEIKNKLELTSKPKLTAGAQNEFNYVSFEGTRPDGTAVTVTIQSGSADGMGETQVGINTFHNGKVNSIRGYVSSLRAMVSRVGNRPHFSVLLSGERNGRLPADLVREMSGKAFRKVDAELVDSAFIDGNSTHKGYTRLIKDTVIYNCKRVNIEIDTRYDRARNITEIIIASPNATDGV